MESLEIQFWESLCGRYLKTCDWISKRWNRVLHKEREKKIVWYRAQVSL